MKKITISRFNEKIIVRIRTNKTSLLQMIEWIENNIDAEHLESCKLRTVYTVSYFLSNSLSPRKRMKTLTLRFNNNKSFVKFRDKWLDK
jgi:hypothetical protein